MCRASILFGLATGICLPSVMYIFVTFFTLPFDELSLVGLALDLFDSPLSLSAMRLLVGSLAMCRVG